MQTDFWLMLRLAALVEWLPGLEWLDVRSLVGQFGASLSSQVRLNVEAQHLRGAAKHFASWRDVGIPEVHFASEAVIVESFVAGRTVGSYVAGLATESSAASASDALDLEQRAYIVRRGVDICAHALWRFEPRSAAAIARFASADRPNPVRLLLTFCPCLDSGLAQISRCSLSIISCTPTCTRAIYCLTRAHGPEAASRGYLSSILAWWLR